MSDEVVIDPHHPDYIEFSARLHRRLALFQGRDLDDNLLKDMQAAANRLRANSRLALPPLVVVLVKACGAIEVVRADMEREAVIKFGAELLKKYGMRHIASIEEALRCAFPQHFNIQ